jgi:hypothetical protein
MKFILFVVFATFIQFSFAQNQASPVSVAPFFAQGLYPDLSEADTKALESEIRDLPFVQVARLDIPTKRFFILTKDLNQLDELTLRSWFSDKGDDLRCIQIGVQGVDAVNPFPFTNCQN